MRKFDSNVQILKYKVLREVARHTWEGNDIFSMFNEIAKEVVRKDHIPMRCCIYKDRAIVAERIRIALGGNKKQPGVVEVIDIACDDCPQTGYMVTDMCRGCIAHQCQGACPKEAIEFDEHLKAHIDKKKCIECGQCARVCPYNAINNFRRPCETACQAGAIHMAETCEAEIDYEKCTGCGACVSKCPFGAPVDKSHITDVVKMLKERVVGTGERVHAVVAPSYVTQFGAAKPGQIVAAIRHLGFDTVQEVALGADMTACAEAEELAHKDDFITTSCCPAFVSYIKANFPELEGHISSTLSPMAMIGQQIKRKEPASKVVFIGPCVAKKEEAMQENVKELIDKVLTFEELQALIDARDIPVTELEEEILQGASIHGVGFAKSGGVAAAVEAVLQEQGCDKEIQTATASGLDKCKGMLRLTAKGKAKFDLLEGMACENGCISGTGCLTHQAVDGGKWTEQQKQPLMRM